MDCALICGLPNAGKTTYSAQFEYVIHFDDFKRSARHPNDQFKLCNQAATQADGDVCVEGVYNSRRRRMEFLEAVKDKPGKRVCIWLDAPVDECCRRENRHRPIGIVYAHARSFQPPTLDEGWDEIRIIKTTEGGRDEQGIHIESKT